MRVLLNRYWEYFYLNSGFDFLMERFLVFSIIHDDEQGWNLEQKKCVKISIKKRRNTENQSPLKKKKNQNQNSDNNTQY